MNTEEIQKKISDIEKRLEILEKNSTRNEKDNTIVKARTKSMSVREYLLTKKSSNDVEKTVALAYYLEHLVKMDSFNTDDLEKAFRDAKEKPPANLNDKINKNIAKGYLMEAEQKKESKKAWVLTSTGENFVETELQ